MKIQKSDGSQKRYSFRSSDMGGQCDTAAHLSLQQVSEITLITFHGSHAIASDDIGMRL